MLAWTRRALGLPACPPSRPLPPRHPRPTPAPTSPSLGSSCVAAGSNDDSTSPATHGALCANVVWDVGVLAELDARQTSGTPTSPSRIGRISIAVQGKVVVVAEAARVLNDATTTLPPLLVLGVEAVGAAAEIEAAGVSAAPTASRGPIPGDQMQEADSPPQAPHASFMPFSLKLAAFCFLLLVLLSSRLLGDEACAEAVRLQVTSNSSM